MRKCIFILLALLAFGATQAMAHAHLDHAEPPAGAVVKAAPREVTLWFTKDLDAALSTIEVKDGSGKRLDRGPAEISGRVMRIAVGSLPSGSYTVFWHAVSVDTHKTEGSFSFSVELPATPSR